VCAPCAISSSDIGLILYVTHQLGQIHFRLSRLKAACHRSLRQLLELIRTRALQEEKKTGWLISA